MIGHPDTTVIEEGRWQTFNMPVAELSERDEKMLRDRDIIPIEITWEEGPLVPGPTTAEIPLGLRATPTVPSARESDFSLGCGRGTTDCDFLREWRDSAADRLCLRPDAKVTFFSLHAHLLRQVDGYKYD